MVRSRSRIIGKGGLIQGTNLLGGDESSMLHMLGSGGMPAPPKCLKIDAKILQFRDISKYKMLLFCLQILHYVVTACVNVQESFRQLKQPHDISSHNQWQF